MMQRIKKFLLLAGVIGLVWGSSMTVGFAESVPLVDSSSVEKIDSSVPLGDVYRQKTAGELAQMVRSGEVTSTQLVQAALAEVKGQNPEINAVITLRETAALNEAAALIDTGQPFLGVPLLLKGLGQTLKGESNTNGFAFGKDQIAGGTSAFVKALQNAGFIIIGQTNFPELGYKNITDTTLYGPASSPWNPLYQAGGSSGGAGASVAAGLVPVASGSDAGGSIRIPASWNGVIGLKPTRGVISGNGASERVQTVHFANTKSMKDTKLLFDALKNPQVSNEAEPSLTNITIGYSTKSPVGTPVSEEAVQAVNEAVAFLKEQGFTVEEVDNPIDGVQLMKSYYTIGAGGASIANFIGKQILKRDITIDDVDLVTWALYQTGKVTTKAEIDEAWAFNQQAAMTMENFHQQYPLFLTPTTAYTAPLVGDSLITPENKEKMEAIDTLAPEERKQLIYDQWLTALTLSPYTQQANLTGEPAISLPTFVSASGLPLGIQFNAAKGQDSLLLAIGQLFEDQGKFKLLHPVKEEGGTNDSSSEFSESTTENMESTTTTVTGTTTPEQTSASAESSTTTSETSKNHSASESSLATKDSEISSTKTATLQTKPVMNGSGDTFGSEKNQSSLMTNVTGKETINSTTTQLKKQYPKAGARENQLFLILGVLLVVLGSFLIRKKKLK